MSKQTALEWFASEIAGDLSPSYGPRLQGIFEQALQMEREQIVSFCYDFIPTIQVVDNETVFTQLPEEIYNKTYGKEASHEG